MALARGHRRAWHRKTSAEHAQSWHPAHLAAARGRAGPGWGAGEQPNAETPALQLRTTTFENWQQLRSPVGCRLRSARQPWRAEATSVPDGALFFIVQTLAFNMRATTVTRAKAQRPRLAVTGGNREQDKQMNATHKKIIADRSIIERWTRPDGYTVSVRTYYYADRKTFTVSLGVSTIIDHGVYVEERMSLLGGSVRLAAHSVNRFSARTMNELHTSTVTPEVIETIQSMLMTDAAIA